MISAVAIFATRLALPITSAGRSWPLGPLGTCEVAEDHLFGAVIIIQHDDLCRPALASVDREMIRRVLFC